jgi:hypothetical protein
MLRVILPLFCLYGLSTDADAQGPFVQEPLEQGFASWRLLPSPSVPWVVRARKGPLREAPPKPGQTFVVSYSSAFECGTSSFSI